MLVLGLMSGTSADGVDAVLTEFHGPADQPKWSLLNLVSIPYPDDLRATVIGLGQGMTLSSKDWLELAETITEIHAQAAKECDPQSKSQLVGCHGQTVWHRPPKNNKYGASWQMLRAPLLAKLLQQPVVHDFRAADMALGGQGAPLVPMPDAALLGKTNGWQAVLNLGGIANLTLIPPLKGPDRSKSVIGWDCGPGNTLVDLAMQTISGGQLSFDRDGVMAANGIPDNESIKSWLKESFFQQLPPKSTGREEFGMNYLERLLKTTPTLAKENLIATLTAFTAATVAQDLETLYEMRSIKPINLFIAGGGSKNQTMVHELTRRCKGIQVLQIEERGIPSQAREALAFALLAWWHVLKHPGNAPEITGAKRKTVLGVKANYY